MNPMMLAGLSFVGLGAALRANKVPVERRRAVRATAARGRARGEGKVMRQPDFGPSPKQRAEQRRISRNVAQLQQRHKHAFVIGGRRFATTGTFFDPNNPRLHTHFLSVPVFVQGQRPGSLKKVMVRVVTSFDRFGAGHVHTTRIRDRVFTSGGPF